MHYYSGEGYHHASLHLKHTHTPHTNIPPVRFSRKKKKNITQRCWSELFSPLALLSGPLTEAVMVWGAGSPEFVHHWFVKNSSSSCPAAADVLLLWILTQNFQTAFPPPPPTFSSFQWDIKWTHKDVYKQRHTNPRAWSACAHRQMLCVCKNGCLICKTVLGKAGAKQAIRGSSSWALHCILLTFRERFMSKDLSPSQQGLPTQLCKTHNKGTWGGTKKT